MYFFLFIKQEKIIKVEEFISIIIFHIIILKNTVTPNFHTIEHWKIKNLILEKVILVTQLLKSIDKVYILLLLRLLCFIYIKIYRKIIELCLFYQTLF